MQSCKNCIHACPVCKISATCSLGHRFCTIGIGRKKMENASKTVCSKWAGKNNEKYVASVPFVSF